MNIGDAHAAADYAVSILQDSKQYQRMQAAMLADIQQRFHSSKIADQYEHYYEKMLGDGHTHV